MVVRRFLVTSVKRREGFMEGIVWKGFGGLWKIRFWRMSKILRGRE